MKVTLLNWTPDPAALTLLLRTKGTRLGHEDDPAEWSQEKRLEHLSYMRDTIKSSWEFLDYTFLIEDVTRAFTHQLVRTRHGSYAQESQRTVDVRNNGYAEPFGLRERELPVVIEYQEAMEDAIGAYARLIGHGMPVQDARGVLPTNMFTSIVAKFSLRTLHEMAGVRLCTRTQGEYQEVFRNMKRVVCDVHPWAEPFIRVACAQTGVCIFPRYKECPIQPLTYNGMNPKDHHVLLEIIQRKAEATHHAATPVAKEGMTQ